MYYPYILMLVECKVCIIKKVNLFIYYLFIYSVWIPENVLRNYTFTCLWNLYSLVFCRRWMLN